MTAITTTVLRQWLDRFIVARDGAGLSPQTLRNYRGTIKQYLLWLDENPGRDPVAVETLEWYLAARRKQISLATVAATYRVLHVFFAWATKQKLIPGGDSPMKSVNKPRVPRQRVQHVTLEEFNRLYNSIPTATWVDYRDRIIILVMFYSGLRIGELIALHVNDLDFDNDMILVGSGKGGDARYAPCASDLLKPMVEGYLRLRPKTTETRLILSADGRHGLRDILGLEGVRMVLQRRCKAAGVRWLNPHAFRHGFAMLFLNSGMRLSAVSAVMGHKDSRVTQDVYARWLTPGIQREYKEARARLGRDAA